MHILLAQVRIRFSLDWGSCFIKHRGHDEVGNMNPVSKTNVFGKLYLFQRFRLFNRFPFHSLFYDNLCFNFNAVDKNKTGLVFLY